MRLLIDTNILLYAANMADPAHDRARDYLHSTLNEQTPWCLTWPVIYEFLRVATHRKVFPRPLLVNEALDFLAPLFASPTLTILTPTSRHSEVLANTLAEIAPPSGNLFHDVATAVTLREHGVPEVVTADTDFLQFRFLKVTNPLLPTQSY
jgi:uncharacterized protein